MCIIEAFTTNPKAGSKASPSTRPLPKTPMWKEASKFEKERVVEK